MEALPKLLRRTAALGLLAVFLALAVLAALAPFARLAAVNEEITTAADLIAQQERLLRAAARRPAQAARRVLLAGETSGMAGAELQRLVSDLARRSGMTLRSTNVTEPKREAELTAIGVDVSLQGPMPSLRSFLHDIETGVPILFIESLSIRSVPAYQPVQLPVTLEVALRIRGYGDGKEVN
jgi:general secretion pathway protein M